MIGQVTFRQLDTTHVATLTDRGEWMIKPPLEFCHESIMMDLDAISKDYRGPSDGPFGPRQVAEAAEMLRGTFILEPKRDAPPGTIY